MSKSTALLVISASILVIHMLTLSFPAVEAAGDHHIGWIPTTTGCRGSMAECLAEGGDLDIDDMELSMDSEINRRILATNRRYISYGALSKNNVPCSRRGASYYNCRSGGQANPYSRGCSAITRCRHIHIKRDDGHDHDDGCEDQMLGIEDQGAYRVGGALGDGLWGGSPTVMRWVTGLIRLSNVWS
ncbi:putative rapid ALkalinization Factor [Helianthus annuus]|uniref:Rapid ALkalinization Factor n=1 Tax=Helianthus annuus TaxID=4232 RepID=A0A9K3JI72_HELAN|nr:putative rapid ALkalinization Factor [Helianthus annuus]KAJ0768997.1 putative rapid ALkalinization Factor [Helianthus annuus]KAJ0774743.1 putative rapid ALkalinization Factor [Helianthus annuus]